jgi:osmoprotectant transport system ATP-binding protein
VESGPDIRLERVTKRFGDMTAVDALDLEMPRGAFYALLGPSGCGKTTTLRMINRLIEPSAGTITIEGVDIRQQSPTELRRGIGYVIQQIGLFPHMTIAENVATVPKLIGWPAPRVAARVAEMLALVGLDPGQFLARYPRHLSGGQRQRVGVARALAADPPVMLMDEPFGALDPITRARLQDEFLRILRGLKKTIVFVTHDIDEAVYLADRIAIMTPSPGRVGQYVTVDMERPRDRNSAQANALRSELTETMRRLGSH